MLYGWMMGEDGKIEKFIVNMIFQFFKTANKISRIWIILWVMTMRNRPRVTSIRKKSVLFATLIFFLCFRCHLASSSALSTKIVIIPLRKTFHHLFQCNDYMIRTLVRKKELYTWYHMRIRKLKSHLRFFRIFGRKFPQNYLLWLICAIIQKEHLHPLRFQNGKWFR